VTVAGAFANGGNAVERHDRGLGRYARFRRVAAMFVPDIATVGGRICRAVVTTTRWQATQAMITCWRRGCRIDGAQDDVFAGRRRPRSRRLQSVGRDVYAHVPAGGIGPIARPMSSPTAPRRRRQPASPRATDH
jgi:hypothetical protein